MGKLGDLTIVILSRDRHKDLTKTLNYYKSLGIHTLVAHKTEAPLSALEIPYSCTYLNINEAYSVRCQEIANVPKSRFTILSSDDERYLPLALSQMILQLEKQHNRGSVGAKNLAIGTYGKRITATETFSNLNSYTNFETDFDSSVNLHFHPNVRGVRVGALYRMYSSQDFDLLLRSLAFGGVASTPYVFECIAEIVSLAIGPITYIENLYWLRNWTNGMIQSPDWNRKETFGSWWKSSKTLPSKVELLGNLESELLISLDSLEKAFIQLLDNRISAESRTTNVKFSWKLHEDAKFVVKRIARSKSLPTTLATELHRLSSLGTVYSETEVSAAVTSMITP